MPLPAARRCFELEMAMSWSSATFAFRDWVVTVRGMPSCEGCLVAGPKHRLDVSFTAHGDAPSRDRPHGIIGLRITLRGDLSPRNTSWLKRRLSWV